MSIFYSSSTGGFYDDRLHGPEAMPIDVVKITIDTHVDLMAGQAAGQIIVAAESGRPILVDAAVPQPTADDVNAERQRRIIAGTDLTLTDYAPSIALQGRPEDQQSLMGLALLAQMLISAGDVSPITFRDRENVDHDLTPAQIAELWQRGTFWMSNVYAASWDLKDQDPIPADFANDFHWPAVAASLPQT